VLLHSKQLRPDSGETEQVGSLTEIQRKKALFDKPLFKFWKFTIEFKPEIEMVV